MSAELRWTGEAYRYVNVLARTMDPVLLGRLIGEATDVARDRRATRVGACHFETALARLADDRSAHALS